MVVGLIMVSTLVAMTSTGVALLLGTGWLSAIGIYLATGMVTSFMLVLRLIVAELHEPGHGGEAALPMESVGNGTTRAA